jgi:hypothetical protein
LPYNININIINIVFPSRHMYLKRHSDFQTKFSRALLISAVRMFSTVERLKRVKTTNYEAFPHVIFLIPLLFLLPEIQLYPQSFLLRQFQYILIYSILRALIRYTKCATCCLYTDNTSISTLD